MLTQDEKEVSHFRILLDFLDVRAQAPESTTSEGAGRSAPGTIQRSNVRTRAAYLVDTGNSCVLCVQPNIHYKRVGNSKSCHSNSTTLLLETMVFV